MYLKVKVKAGSRKEEIERVNENTFHISVKEKAERNMANNRILEILSLELKIPINKIRIINGHQSPSKLISILD
ncbi:MAG: DUF167 domain-containing protein [Candidatus Pacebacteria bacterium]|nr:DUF167 domain-containing protein [Candidatus Paceibacterota bacterium]